MHIYGKSAILDELWEQSEDPEQYPVHYDIRALSREILLRSGGETTKWIDDADTELTLLIAQEGEYSYYELYVQDVNDTDIHRYVFNTIGPTIRYEYPLFTWHKNEKSDVLRERLEVLLLSGPVHDKVPDGRIDNVIQKSFHQIARKLTVESLAELTPEYRTEIYSNYLVSRDESTKKDIVRKLHEKALELNMFVVGPNEFQYAFDTDLSIFSINQKKLVENTDSAE